MNKHVTVRVPFRVSFFGGGTDFPSYFNQFGGSVIGTTINKYSYVSLSILEKIFDNRIKLSYSSVENVIAADDLQHVIAKEIINSLHPKDFNYFLDIHSYADLPSGTGIASSSAFSIGLLLSTHTSFGKYKQPYQLAREAIDIERTKCNLMGGWQDQIHCSFGGLNRINFNNNDFSVVPYNLTKNRIKILSDSCLMVYLNSKRSSSKVYASLENEKVFESDSKLKYLHDLQLITNQADELFKTSLTEGEFISEFGRLIHKNWVAKKSLSSTISSPYIDNLYEKLLNAGAYGGKLLGAGGGGFFLLVFDKKKKNNILKELSNNYSTSFEIETSGPKILWAQ